MIGIRQVALLSADLESDVAIAQQALNTRVVHRDPSIAQFGLRNAVLAMGSGYLELVTPIDADSSAARRLNASGPGFYMLIAQMALPLSAHRDRVVREGFRVVAELNEGSWSSIQLHPADTTVALISLDVVEDEKGWPPVGVHEPVPGCHTTGIGGVVIEAQRTDAVLDKLSRVFGSPATGTSLRLGYSTITARPSGRDAVAEVRLFSSAGIVPPAFTLCGVDFPFVDSGAR
jgi:hypothetical protein